MPSLVLGKFGERVPMSRVAELISDGSKFVRRFAGMSVDDA